MATTPLHQSSTPAMFPAPGVAASVQRAVTAARETYGRPADAARAPFLRILDGARRPIRRRVPALSLRAQS